MEISERQLKQLVLRILGQLEDENIQYRKPENRQKLYMVCTTVWDERYTELLEKMEQSEQYDVYPVISESWQEQGYEDVLRQYKCCSNIRYRSSEKPADIGSAVTVFPVTERDIIVKTALCISDTFETSWVADCMEQGSCIVFLRSGLKRFSGREPSAYTNQILSYYRTVLEYGIQICSVGELLHSKSADKKKSEVIE